MSILDRFFKPKQPEPPPGKPLAKAFVDYEHWYYSFKNEYGLKPDVEAWRDGLAKDYNLADILVFGDFSFNGIRDELPYIRNITNSIIETHQPTIHHKKDMTDFIMLDYIYQTAALNPEIEVYILFTGDGHFHSVVKYLTQRLQKKVVVYGVTGAFSNQLQAAASEAHGLPTEEEAFTDYAKMIVQNMAYVSTKQSIIPSFNGTVAAVSRRYDVKEEPIRRVLKTMLDQGLLVQKDFRVEFNRKVKIITPDWDALEKAGLWSCEDNKVKT